METEKETADSGQDRGRDSSSLQGTVGGNVSEQIPEAVREGDSNEAKEKSEGYAKEETATEEVPGQPISLDPERQEVFSRAEEQLKTLTWKDVVVSELYIKGCMERYVIRQGGFIWGGKEGWLFEPSPQEVLRHGRRFRTASQAQRAADAMRKLLFIDEANQRQARTQELNDLKVHELAKKEEGLK